jgi:hypothetical protein
MDKESAKKYLLGLRLSLAVIIIAMVSVLALIVVPEVGQWMFYVAILFVLLWLIALIYIDRLIHLLNLQREATLISSRFNKLVYFIIYPILANALKAIIRG